MNIIKKITFLIYFISIVGYSQTAITNANFQTAINTCLATNPVNGLCSSSEYGVMPNWDVSKVTYMIEAFHDKPTFNANISAWDVSNVISMYSMFDSAAAFNQDISSWNVGKKTIIMYAMFYKATAFNQDISSWDVSEVVDMRFMFESATFFNQNINSWDVGNVDDMQSMFNRAASFNKDLSSWDVSKVVDMNAMFYEAFSFNQDISSWDVGQVVDMFAMFWDARTFNQDLSSWDVRNVMDMSEMFDTSGLSTKSYDAILKGWSNLALQQNITLGAKNINHCLSETAMQNMADTYGWSIEDAGLNCDVIINKIDVYPNPAKKYLSIEESEISVSVSIYNAVGKKVTAAKSTDKIDLENLPSGIYTLRITDGVSQTFKRFIKL